MTHTVLSFSMHLSRVLQYMETPATADSIHQAMDMLRSELKLDGAIVYM